MITEEEEGEQGEVGAAGLSDAIRERVEGWKGERERESFFAVEAFMGCS